MLSALVLVAPNTELFSTTYLNTVVMKMCLLVPTGDWFETNHVDKYSMCILYFNQFPRIDEGFSFGVCFTVEALMIVEIPSRKRNLYRVLD